MSGKFVVIKLTPGKIFFNPNLCIDFGQSNLPQTLLDQPFGFVYWKLRQVSYDSISCNLIAEVSDYFPRDEDISAFELQKPKLPVRQLTFMNLRDVQTIKTAIYYYQKKVIPRFHENPENYGEIVVHEQLNALKDVNRTLKKHFEVYFKEITFRPGYICFKRHVEEINTQIEISVVNDCLLAEYDHIKSFFAKALKSKKIRVDAVIKIVDNQVTDISAYSPQIDQIDERLIESIKISRTLDITKPTVKTIDKSLFTSDEIFDTLVEEGSTGNVFHQDENEILNALISIKKVRNWKQLEYLAGKKQFEGEKLKFTLHPNFGFLFLIRGESMDHFCWELLNSHATYIWSIARNESSIKMKYKRIENVINFIRNTGRDKYKSSYRHHHLDDDLLFCTINHKDVNSDYINGFVRWKHLLDEKLV